MDKVFGIATSEDEMDINTAPSPALKVAPGSAVRSSPVCSSSQIVLLFWLATL